MDDYFKFECPHCRQRLRCHVRLAGRGVVCPGCERPLVIPPPPSVPIRPAPGETGSRPPDASGG